MFSRRGRGEGGFAVRPVRRGVDDGFDRVIVQNRAVGSSCATAVLCGKLFPLFHGAAVARCNRQLLRALDGVGEHVRPPAHAEARDLHCADAPIDSTASRARRSSNSQLPPATPTPPMHSPPTMIGQPPSIAVQRSGPAASASPSAWATSSDWPWAPFGEVGLLFEAAQTASVSRLLSAKSMRSSFVIY